MFKQPSFGVLAIMKNEALNVAEWLDHYFWIGADRIFLIDNGSTDDSLGRVDAHPMRDRIEVVSRPQPHKQVAHYREMFTAFDIATKCDWLVSVDLDEFLFCKSGKPLTERLHRYRFFDVVYVNWTIFGSSGHDQHPQSLRKTLIDATPEVHRLTKWIARTDKLRPEQIDVHVVKDVRRRRRLVDNKALQLNHYVTQSRQFFGEVKMTRGDAAKLKHDQTRNWAYFESYDRMCTAQNTCLRDLLDQS